MAAVQRILPRHWDGRRLLRFLTGLALLALAFTLPAQVAPVPAAPPAAAVSSASPADAAATADAPPTADAAVPARAAEAVAAEMPTAGAAVRVEAIAMLAGISAHAHGSRGPPLA